jgi:hypothetical protein
MVQYTEQKHVPAGHNDDVVRHRAQFLDGDIDEAAKRGILALPQLSDRKESVCGLGLSDDLAVLQNVQHFAEDLRALASVDRSLAERSFLKLVNFLQVQTIECKPLE